MPVLVVYASKQICRPGDHGTDRGQAHQRGTPGRSARPVQEASGLEGYDAFVIGSAAYAFPWMGEALAFVKCNSAVLKRVPVWLFSSGPLGHEAIDAKGRDLRAATVPKEIPGLAGVVGAHGHHVFFGALDPATLGFAERAIRKLPAARAGLPEGDFRDWDDVDAWAAEIAQELTPRLRRTETGSRMPVRPPRRAGPAGSTQEVPSQPQSPGGHAQAIFGGPWSTTLASARGTWSFSRSRIECQG